MQLLVSETGITAESVILDVGGSEYNWNLLPFLPNVTFLNIRNDGQAPLIIADGCQLPFADNTFDIVFSNSLIEHLSTTTRQKEFAAECRRVGRGYFIQTPNRSFPIEPHRLAPWYNSWPKWAKRRAHLLTPWGWLSGATPQQAREFFDEHLPLDSCEMETMFPQSRILKEKACGFTKSVIAIYRPR